MAAVMEHRGNELGTMVAVMKHRGNEGTNGGSHETLS